MVVPDVLHFYVEQQGSGRDITYIIKSADIALSIAADTIEKALHRLQEAVELYYTGTRAKLPRIVVSMSHLN